MVDSSMIQGTTFPDLRRSVDVYGDRLATAQRILEHMHDVIDGRLRHLRADAEREGVPEEIKKYEGPAYEVHIYEPRVVVDDMLCRESIEHAAHHARRTGVVIFWHGDLDVITEAFAPYSRALAAALMAGEAFRWVAPQPRPSWSAGSGNGWKTEDPYGNRGDTPRETPAGEPAVGDDSEVPAPATDDAPAGGDVPDVAE